MPIRSRKLIKNINHGAISGRYNAGIVLFGQNTIIGSNRNDGNILQRRCAGVIVKATNSIITNNTNNKIPTKLSSQPIILQRLVGCEISGNSPSV